MQKYKHVVLIAGEESGDQHAATLIKDLKKLNPNIRCSGIGGTHMQEAGAEVLFNLAQYGVTGFTEVIRLLGTIRKAFKTIKNHLKQTKPDLLILIDYPGFNLRLARFAKEQLNLKILYYISPQIWAWKANRINHIKKYVDHMAVILPFEKAIYEQAHVPASFVGHPLIQHIPKDYDAVALKATLKLPNEKRIIALLPGSRKHEIHRHWPVLIETMSLLLKEHPQTHFVLPIANTIGEQLITSYLGSQHAYPLTIIQGHALECMAAADFVLVASGTASLECALLKKPLAILYKSNFFTYHLAMKLIKVKYLGLCNLLRNEMLAAEFLQYDCNASELARHVIEFFKHPSYAQQMTGKLQQLYDSLSQNNIDCTLADLVHQQLSLPPQSDNANIF